jgi:GH24 family phage-related lysozyme (muramidase)
MLTAQSVLDNALKFQSHYEGAIPWMYLDIKGLVTCGIGFLIDPKPLALSLPWQRLNGTPASTAEIAVEWDAIKGYRDLAKMGAGACAKLTKLRLSQAAMQSILMKKMAENEVVFLHYLPKFGDFPADGQLLVHSMAWACGPGIFAVFKQFSASANENTPESWENIAGKPGNPSTDPSLRGQCWMRDGAPGQASANENPGLRPRNLANRQLALNAARVLRGELPAGLVWSSS